MLIYNQYNFTKYSYVYNIWLHTLSKLFILYKASKYIFLNWVINKNRVLINFKTLSLLNYGYKPFGKKIYIYLSKAKYLHKPYSNSKKASFLYAGFINNLLMDVASITNHSILNIKIESKNLLGSGEMFVFYKLNYFNLLKFKDLFQLFLFILPLYIMNIYEAFSTVIGYKRYLHNNSYLLIPYLFKKYFFFNYYL
jgi:hypothetical protein